MAERRDEAEKPLDVPIRSEQGTLEIQGLNLPPEVMEELKGDIAQVLSKYVDDRESPTQIDIEPIEELPAPAAAPTAKVGRKKRRLRKFLPKALSKHADDRESPTQIDIEPIEEPPAPASAPPAKVRRRKVRLRKFFPNLYALVWYSLWKVFPKSKPALVRAIPPPQPSQEESGDQVGPQDPVVATSSEAPKQEPAEVLEPTEFRIGGLGQEDDAPDQVPTEVLEPTEFRIGGLGQEDDAPDQEPAGVLEPTEFRIGGLGQDDDAPDQMPTEVLEPTELRIGGLGQEDDAPDQVPTEVLKPTELRIGGLEQAPAEEPFEVPEVVDPIELKIGALDLGGEAPDQEPAELLEPTELRIGGLDQALAEEPPDIPAVPEPPGLTIAAQAPDDEVLEQAPVEEPPDIPATPEPAGFMIAAQAPEDEVLDQAPAPSEERPEDRPLQEDVRSRSNEAIAPGLRSSAAELGTPERANEEPAILESIRAGENEVRLRTQQLLEDVAAIQQEAKRSVAEARNTFAKAVVSALTSIATTSATLEEAIATQRNLQQLTGLPQGDENIGHKATAAILDALATVSKANDYVSREMDEARRITTAADSLKQSSQDDLIRVQAMISEATAQMREEAAAALADRPPAKITGSSGEAVPQAADVSTEPEHPALFSVEAEGTYYPPEDEQPPRSELNEQAAVTQVEAEGTDYPAEDGQQPRSELDEREAAPQAEPDISPADEAGPAYDELPSTTDEPESVPTQEEAGEPSEPGAQGPLFDNLNSLRDAVARLKAQPTVEESPSAENVEVYSGTVRVLFTPEAAAATLPLFWDVMAMVASTSTVVEHTTLEDGSGHEFTLSLGDEMLELKQLKSQMPEAEIVVLGADRLHVQMASIAD